MFGYATISIMEGKQPQPYLYPLPVARALHAAEQTCAQSAGASMGESDACHVAVLFLADAIVDYLSAVAVAAYMQSVYTGRIQPDPVLNRSLRSLRRVLPGQRLGWISRGLAATSALDGPVPGLHEWYNRRQEGDVARAYQSLHRFMVEQLAYRGDYGPQDTASPRLLLELVDQYLIKRGRASASSGAGTQAPPTGALLAGLRSLLDSTPFFSEYRIYAPHQRRLLMGLEPTTPVPPIVSPADAEATILLYPPGEAPDFTARPDLQSEHVPLFPLDPLMVYMHCPQCHRLQVAALQAVTEGVPSYIGLDPQCGHSFRPVQQV